MKKIILGIILIGATAFTVMGCTSEVTGAPVANPAPVTITETAPAPPPPPRPIAPRRSLAEKIDAVPGMAAGSGDAFMEMTSDGEMRQLTIDSCWTLGRTAYVEAAVTGFLEGDPDAPRDVIAEVFGVVFDHYCSERA